MTRKELEQEVDNAIKGKHSLHDEGRGLGIAGALHDLDYLESTGASKEKKLAVLRGTRPDIPKSATIYGRGSKEGFQIRRLDASMIIGINLVITSLNLGHI